MLGLNIFLHTFITTNTQVNLCSPCFRDSHSLNIPNTCCLYFCSQESYLFNSFSAQKVFYKSSVHCFKGIRLIVNLKVTTKSLIFHRDDSFSLCILSCQFVFLFHLVNAELFAFLTHLQTGGRTVKAEMFIYSEKTFFGTSLYCARCE